ncbi:hypothetical protein KI387_018848, partial [Taxus chinensis]
MKIIEALVEHELECSADIVMEEDKEESIGKDHSSVGGPSLSVMVPKGMHIRGKCMEIQRKGMNYINDPSKVLCERFQSTILTDQLLVMNSFDEE